MRKISKSGSFFNLPNFCFPNTFDAINHAEISFNCQFVEVWQPLRVNNERFPTFLPYTVFMAAHFMVMIGSCLQPKGTKHTFSVPVYLELIQAIWQIFSFLSKAPPGIARGTRLPLIRVIKTGVPMPTGFTNMRDAGSRGDLRTHYPQGRSSDGTQSEEIEGSVGPARGRGLWAERCRSRGGTVRMKGIRHKREERGEDE